jgi:protein ImuA
MSDSVTSLAALKRRLALLEGVPTAKSCGHVPTGHAPFDQALEGGFARGRVHELFGGPEDEGAAAGLSLILAHLAAEDGPIFWLRAAASAGGKPYGEGLVALGLDPARLLIGVMADEAALLRAAVDALRCAALGALVIELHGRAPLLDLTASRRLALAAEASGATALLLRIGGDPVPSAAETRWRVAAAPSTPLPGNAPGMSAFDLSLLRRRSGPDGMRWRLVWNSERGVFGDECDERHDLGQDKGGQDSGGGGASAPLSGAMVSVPAARSAADRAA